MFPTSDSCRNYDLHLFSLYIRETLLEVYSHPVCEYFYSIFRMSFTFLPSRVFQTARKESMTDSPRSYAPAF